LVESGEFREDLYYRLNVVEIQVAPLRNRKSDIPELVNNFILELNSSLGRSIDKHIVKCIDESALHMLMSYDWPGNIRELRNVIERAMNRCYEETLSAEHFRDTLPEGKDEMFFDSFTISCEDKLSDIRIKTEKYVITYLLEEKGMNVQDAAKSLGISRQMLHKKIKQYNIR
ncbi:MAG: helix-turn-helix domain-containing protein, partial [Anaerovoracaceae bacterium]